MDLRSTRGARDQVLTSVHPLPYLRDRGRFLTQRQEDDHGSHIMVLTLGYFTVLKDQLAGITTSHTKFV